MIELDNVPELVDPVLIAAFEGWNDAGEAASGAIQHLEREWDATSLGVLDPDDYYDFQVSRPSVEITDSGHRRIVWPATRLSLARLPGAGRDVVLVRGIEPNMHWRAFCEDLIGIIRDLDVETVVLLGALLADSPHTRPVPITGCLADHPDAPVRSVEPSDYEGPTGIVGVLHDACDRAALNTASLWAAVPHYVAQPPSPKATLALLRGLEEVLGLPIPPGDLQDESEAWEHNVNELAEQDTEVADYVRALEEQKDTADLPEASGEAIAQEFERYLRRRDSDP